MSSPRYLAPVLLLALVGCPGPQPATSTGTRVQLAVAHLPPIKREQGHYALWATTDATTSVGQPFLVADDGALTTLEGAAWDGRVAWAGYGAPLDRVLLTQEPPTSTDRTPAKQTILTGSYAQGKAPLALAAPFEPGALEAASGSYVLDNPSTDSLSDMNGVCFMNERRNGGGLLLPFPPPADWGYETWIELKGHMLPLGKFVDPDGPDDWNGYSARTPPFPGEDFDQNLPAGIETGFNLPDLRGAKLVVSVEPRSLNREEVYPSAIRVFEATIPADAEHYKGYAMRNVAAEGLPNGTVTALE